MSEVIRAFVELEPTDDAMVAEIFGDARFGNTEVIGEERFDGDAGAAIAAAARHVGDGDAKRVASFDVVVGGHVVVGENEDAGASGSAVGLIEFHRGTGKQAAKLHFEKRDARRESGIAETAFYSRPGSLTSGFYRNARNRAAVDEAGRIGFD